MRSFKIIINAKLMLLFFKSLRQKILSDGKFGKYFLYAIGEIIIVAIGIIIAIQLNGWNQNRIYKKIEVQYYHSMIDQLENDLDDLRGSVNYNQTYQDQFLYALEIIKANDTNKSDTLGRISMDLFYYSDFRRSSNVFQTLISSGEIKHIKNHRIVENLQELEEKYLYIDRLEDMHGNVIVSQIFPEVKEIVRFEPFQVENNKRLFSYQFQNYISVLLSIMKEKEGLYLDSEQLIAVTIELIENEINNH